MIYTQLPEHFNPRFEVVSCFLESQEKILLLHRAKGKTEGGKWCVPGGKINPDETALEAIVREIAEETGIVIAASLIRHVQKIYVSYPDYDFPYHIFHTIVTERPAVHVKAKEHQDFQWVAPKEAIQLPLVPDEDACIKMVYGI